MPLGQRLRTLREQQRLTQVELARKAHLTQPALSRIEEGHVQQPRLNVLKRLAQALGVGVAYLVGEVDASWGKSRSGESMLGELIGAYESLTAPGRKQLVEYARFVKGLTASPLKRQRRKTRRTTHR